MELLALINVILFPSCIAAMILGSAGIGWFRSRRLWRKTYLFLELEKYEHVSKYCAIHTEKIAPGSLIKKGDLLIHTTNGIMSYKLRK